MARSNFLSKLVLYPIALQHIMLHHTALHCVTSCYNVSCIILYYRWYQVMFYCIVIFHVTRIYVYIYIYLSAYLFVCNLHTYVHIGVYVCVCTLLYVSICVYKCM